MGGQGRTLKQKNCCAVLSVLYCLLLFVYCILSAAFRFFSIICVFFCCRGPRDWLLQTFQYVDSSTSSSSRCDRFSPSSFCSSSFRHRTIRRRRRIATARRCNELRIRNPSRRNAKPLSNEISSPPSKSPHSNHSKGSSNKERELQANDFVTESDVIVERFHVRSNDDGKTDDRLASSRSSDSRRLEIDESSTERKTSHFPKTVLENTVRDYVMSWYKKIGEDEPGFKAVVM